MINVLHSDRLEGSVEADVTYRELIGEVHIRHEDVDITCDRALQNIDQNNVELIGNVVIMQDTLVLKTKRGMYYGNQKIATSVSGIYLNDGHVTLHAAQGKYETRQRIARFRTGVRVDEPSVSIACDSMDYIRDSSKALAAGNVFLSFKDEQAIIKGDSAIHYLKRKISIFPVKPTLWQIDSVVVSRDSVTQQVDSLQLDTLSIVARHMEAHRDSTNRFIADGNVEIVRAGFSATCQEALFLRSDSMIILKVNPILWYERNQITGDVIAAYLADGTIHELHVLKNAFSISQSKPTEKDTLYPPGRFDQTKGENIYFTFRNDKADRIRVEHMAMSLYYLYDGQTLNGVRKESGDLILIDFVDGKADTIHTIGGVEGTYYPEKYVDGNAVNFNLEGFHWREERPQQPPFPVLSLPNVK